MKENSIAESNSSSDSTALSNYEQQDVTKVESYIEDRTTTPAYNPKDDPNHPVVSLLPFLWSHDPDQLMKIPIFQNWPERKKYLALLSLSLDSFIGYFTSAIYVSLGQGTYILYTLTFSNQ